MRTLPNDKTPIKTRFKIIGAADAAANLLWEFKIAEKKDNINPKRNILGKTDLKNLLACFFERLENTVGDITDTKNIIVPANAAFK